MKGIFQFFFKLGALGFGGPIATIAMMEEEAVSHRKWMTAEEFSKAYSILKVFPGATATQMAIFLGRLRGGFLGGVVAGLLFIFPAFLLVLALAYFYEKIRFIPSAGALFSGMQVAALVVILESVTRMAKPYWKKSHAILIALISGAAIFWVPRAEPLFILGFGLMGVLGHRYMSPLLAFPLFSAEAWTSHLNGPLLKLLIVCVKAGFLVFGTGLAIVPLLEADVVGHYHWLTHKEFLDALAVGQVTPGPVVITATFIGYRVSGLIGAILATMAIFCSAFVNVLVIYPFVEKKIGASQYLHDFAEWAFPAVIGGIIATSFRLALMSLTSWPLLVLFALTAVLVFAKGLPSWIVIPLSGIIYFLVMTVVTV